MSKKVLTQDFDTLKPAKRSIKQKISISVYDKDAGTLFGRSGRDCGKLLLFYILFYTALAGLFALCMTAFMFRFVNPRIPSLRLDDSLIGSSPGLGFRPLPPDVRSTFLSFKGTGQKSYEYWENQLIAFFEVYKKRGQQEGAGQNIASCSFESMPRPGQVCDVKEKDWGPCIANNHFSYHKSAPCIFLKLNRIFGWTPDFYNVSDLPEDMPKSMQHEIKNLTKINQNYEKMIWLSCRGETPADEENIGPIDYWPNAGFPGYYFPYLNTEGYLSPLVAVHFRSPNTGILINIECRAWARNIKYDKKERIGAIHFELMVE